METVGGNLLGFHKARTVDLAVAFDVKQKVGFARFHAASADLRTRWMEVFLGSSMIGPNLFSTWSSLSYRERTVELLSAK
jgi:hypothetical protein